MLLVCLVALVIAAAVFPIRDPDLWFHLASGRWIAEHHAVPRADPFSFTAQGEDWVAFEWGFDFLAYVVHRHGGPDAIILVKTALLLATVLVLYRACRAAAASPEVAVALLALWVLMSEIVFYCRPHMVSYCLLATTVATALEWRRGRPARLWLLPPLFALWANLHAGFLAGLLVLGTLVAAEAVAALRDPAARPRLVRIVLATLAAALATLLNPFGSRVYEVPGKIAGSGYLLATIQEWLPVWDPTIVAAPDALMFYGWVVLGTIAILADRERRDRVADLVLLLGLALLAAKAARQIPIFGIVSLPILAPRLERLLSRMGGRRLAPATAPGRRAAAGLALGLVLLGLCLWSAVLGFPTTRRKVLALGVNRRMIPVDAVDWMEANGVAGRTFNSYAFGGYLVWRQWPRTLVSMDGRCEVYGEARVREQIEAMASPAAFDAFAERHRVEVAVIQSRERALWTHLERSPAWEPLYADPVARVARRREPAR